MEYAVQVQQVESIPLAVVRRRATIDQLSQIVPEACGVVWDFVRKAQVKPAGRHVAIYLDDVMNLEVGVEVPASFAGAGEVIRSQTPAGNVATVAHFGPYHLLKEAHEAIHRWGKDQQREFIRPCWEIYGHWTDDQAKLRTDVFYLIK